jgi:phosphoribosyl 1,2-cyclic phosphodiesterase
VSFKICLLASGSKGNCAYVSDGKTSILIDIGLPYSTLRQMAQKSDIDLSGVSAVVSTHCHIDHCRGMAVFARKHDIPVYAHGDGAELLALKTGLKKSGIIPFNKDFTVGSLALSPFLLPHDAPACCGFSVYGGGKKLSIATDLGSAENVLENMYGSDLAVIECNHDVNMLLEGRYPPALKRRIMSELGHLSNDDCAVSVKTLAEKGTKNFILAHLSEENNLPELAYFCVTRHLSVCGIAEGRDYRLTIAYQRKSTHIIDI